MVAPWPDRSVAGQVRRRLALRRAYARSRTTHSLQSDADPGGAPISVIGVNFDGQPGNDKVLIDNVECEVLSSSPVSILAMPPTRLTAGPLREMFVTAKGESSPAVEVDSVGITSTIDTVDGAADALFKLTLFTPRCRCCFAMKTRRHQRFLWLPRRVRSCLGRLGNDSGWYG
ncbi:MAG: IPT/TIG domain-containing protein [Candidatus Obscuribacterales bacterium]